MTCHKYCDNILLSQFGHNKGRILSSNITPPEHRRFCDCPVYPLHHSHSIYVFCFYCSLVPTALPVLPSVSSHRSVRSSSVHATRPGSETQKPRCSFIVSNHTVQTFKRGGYTLRWQLVFAALADTL